jgi:polygalacturonase
MERSVLEFGALGNGIHDDYPAFQAALDSGGTVIIPHLKMKSLRIDKI